MVLCGTAGVDGSYRVSSVVGRCSRGRERTAEIASAIAGLASAARDAVSGSCSMPGFAEIQSASEVMRCGTAALASDANAFWRRVGRPDGRLLFCSASPRVPPGRFRTGPCAVRLRTRATPPRARVVPPGAPRGWLSVRATSTRQRRRADRRRARDRLGSVSGCPVPCPKGTSDGSVFVYGWRVCVSQRRQRRTGRRHEAGARIGSEPSEHYRAAVARAAPRLHYRPRSGPPLCGP